MTQEVTPPPSVDPVAPASPAPADQVAIGLGPDLGIYPHELRPAETSAAPAPAPEAAPPEPSEAPEQAAGSAPPPQEPQAQGSRRRANEDAYQRGLTEGRAALQREQETQHQQSLVLQTQQQANQRVEQLFRDLEAPDYATQDRARQGILQMYRGNQQAQALMQTTRLQILQEMAADFANLRDLDGIADADYQHLHTAPSAAELAKRAFDLGKKARDEQVVRLEAELEGLRGRLVGSRATPERANGPSSSSDTITLEQYAAMSPKEARQLRPAQVDALTALMAAEAERAAHRT